MIDKLAAKGRKMVTIIDPHIKRDDNYFVHKEGRDQGFYIKNKDGNDYDGWCWPGTPIIFINLIYYSFDSMFRSVLSTH